MLIPSWVAPFRFFCSKLSIDSKETGVSPLLLYGSQEKYLEEIIEGYQRGVRNFVILKSRQLGVSTISIALDLFWAYVNPGLQGAIITHDEASREDFRAKITRYANSLPKSMKLFEEKSNRYRLEFTNGSVLNLMVAGSRAKGTLGRAFGLNFVHGTECSSWGDEEGLASLRNSLAENYPNRLYIFESTARGFNMWNRIWHQAGEDPTQKRFFLGWYLRQDQTVKDSDPRLKIFWDGQYTQDEEDKVKTVKERYNIDITPNQMAWYRWKTQNIGDEIMAMQEQPWTEEEAFIMSGSPFFPIRQLTQTMRGEMDTEFKAYRYNVGDNFLATQIEPVNHIKHAHLRIWEEPHPEGEYIIGADPAFGVSDTSDRSCAQVFRCYADRLIQVAEFASTDLNTSQFAWVIAHLGGAYKNTMVNLEITGPGMAVWQELQHLRQQFTMSNLGERAKDYGINDIFGSIRWFYYHRPDSTSSGLAFHWKTNFENKRRMLNQFKSDFQLKVLELHSVPLLEEMSTITVGEGSIGGEGASKDDRVMASALGIVAWVDWIRKKLMAQGRFYEAEQERIRLKMSGQPQMTMSQVIVADFFHRQQVSREEAEDPRKWRA